MKNKYNLPRTLVQAMDNTMGQYKKTGDISVTELIDSPQIFALKKKHQGEIEDDYAHRIKSWIGSLVHEALKNAEHSTILDTGRLACTVQVDGKEYTLSGEPDYYDPELKVLRDYKTASVKSKDYRDEHYGFQLNLYAYLLAHHGMPVEKAEIVYIYTDWSFKDGETKDGYPTPTRIVDVPLWRNGDALAYIQERMRHAFSENPKCTDEDRWSRKTVYAVKGQGKTRAISLHDTIGDARNALKPGQEIEVRPGENIRCMYYCPVASVCTQK